MGGQIVDRQADRIASIHGSFLEAVEDLSEELFKRKPGPNAPSVAFHLWHTARWADAFHQRFGGFAPELQRFTGRQQIWETRSLAVMWGLGERLGKESTGMGLDDDASAALPLPMKDDVVAYARAAFSAADGVFREVDDAQLLIPTADFYNEGGWKVIDHFGWHLSHAARHLGMIEALKGVFGLAGTASV